MVPYLFFPFACLISVSFSADAPFKVLYAHPTCELWVWMREGDEPSSPFSLAGLSTGSGRSMFSTTISSYTDADAAPVLQHGSALLPGDGPFSAMDHVEADTSDMLVLWHGSSNALYINATWERKRPQLALLMDFLFFTDGKSHRKQRITIRKGDDIFRAVSDFVNKHAPGIPEQDFIRLRDRVLATVEDSLLRNAESVELLRTAVQDVIAEQGELNIIVGETEDKISKIAEQSWVHFSVNSLDLTFAHSFAEFLKGGLQAQRIMAEHVWEHLTLAEAVLAAQHCFQALAPGGMLRIAVPDYNWPIFHGSASGNSDTAGLLSPSERMDMLSSTGTLLADIKDEHLVHWSVCSLTEMLVAAGFGIDDITAQEFVDPSGDVVIRDWKYSDGPIMRSSRGRVAQSSSIVIDARKARGDVAIARPVLVAFDCTANSLARSSSDMWLHLIGILRAKLDHRTSGQFGIIIILPPPSESTSELEKQIRSQLRDSAIFVKHAADAEICEGCLSLPHGVLDSIADMRVTHFVTADSYYERCSGWRSSLNGGNSLNVVSLHMLASTSDRDSTLPCRVPFVSSAAERNGSAALKAACRSTRLGISAATFGHDITEKSIGDVREQFVQSFIASKSSAKVVNKIRENPYVVVPLFEAHCSILVQNANCSIFSLSGGMQCAGADVEVFRMFWSIVDGIVEGSVSMHPSDRPWVVLLGDCDWRDSGVLMDPFRRLSDLDWVGAITSGYVDFRKRIIAGAAAVVTLPLPSRGCAEGGAGALTQSLLPALEAMAFGAAAIVGPPYDFHTVDDDGFNSTVASRYLRSYYNGSLVHLSTMEPMDIWMAIRHLIANKKSRQINVWNARRFFFGWNTFASAVFEQMNV